MSRAAEGDNVWDVHTEAPIARLESLEELELLVSRSDSSDETSVHEAGQSSCSSTRYPDSGKTSQV